MDERAFESRPPYLDPDRINLIIEVLHLDNVGRRIAFIVAGKDPKNLSRLQRKVLGDGVAKIISEMTFLEYLQVAAGTYVEMADLFSEINNNCS
jgi:hypothetical protein